MTQTYALLLNDIIAHHIDDPRFPYNEERILLQTMVAADGIAWLDVVGAAVELEPPIGLCTGFERKEE